MENSKYVEWPEACFKKRDSKIRLALGAALATLVGVGFTFGGVIAHVTAKAKLDHTAAQYRIEAEYKAMDEFVSGNGNIEDYRAKIDKIEKMSNEEIVKSHPDGEEVLEQVKSKKTLGKAYCTAGVATALAIVTNSLKKKDKEEENEC